MQGYFKKLNTIKIMQKVKISEIIKELSTRVKYIAIDSKGRKYGFYSLVKQNNTGWVSTESDKLFISTLISIDNDSTNWQESLREVDYSDFNTVKSAEDYFKDPETIRTGFANLKRSIVDQIEEYFEYYKDYSHLGVLAKIRADIAKAENSHSLFDSFNLSSTTNKPQVDFRSILELQMQEKVSAIALEPFHLGYPVFIDDLSKPPVDRPSVLQDYGTKGIILEEKQQAIFENAYKSAFRDAKSTIKVGSIKIKDPNLLKPESIFKKDDTVYVLSFASEMPFGVSCEGVVDEIYEDGSVSVKVAEDVFEVHKEGHISFAPFSVHEAGFTQVRPLPEPKRGDDGYFYFELPARSCLYAQLNNIDRTGEYRFGPVDSIQNYRYFSLEEPPMLKDAEPLPLKR